MTTAARRHSLRADFAASFGFTYGTGYVNTGNPFLRVEQSDRGRWVVIFGGRGVPFKKFGDAVERAAAVAATGAW